MGEIETDRGRLDQWMIRTGTFPSGALTTEGDGPETVIGCARQALDIDSDKRIWLALTAVVAVVRFGIRERDQADRIKFCTETSPGSPRIINLKKEKEFYHFRRNEFNSVQLPRTALEF